MTDFLLELLSEEIPARMQDKARDDLATRLRDRLGDFGLHGLQIESFATPRRLAVIVRDLPDTTPPGVNEFKGPRTSAPQQALDGFLRSTGLRQDQLENRDGVWFATVDKPGRATADVIAEAIPAIVRAFPWPKSMRWGAASIGTESPRWVRPLQGVVALFGEEIVECEIAGIRAGAATVGHRFHHKGPITIGGAHDYVEKLRACHVIVDQEERKTLIRDGARALAAEAGLTLVEDEGLVSENAGLTEWPVPLLGSFDPQFLDVPPEVIQLTMRTNQKYFALASPRKARGGGPSPEEAMVEGYAGHREQTRQPLHHQPAADGPPPQASLGEERLAPNFICTANLAATDGGAKIAQGNAKVLAARLADARFFWEQDRKATLAQHAERLKDIVFHEKLGTVADKVDRVAKLARWLITERIVTPAKAGAHAGSSTDASASTPDMSPGFRRDDEEVEALALQAETAARLCKADLVTAMVGEFPELQGVMGGHYARAERLPAEVADAIRDHYKPVGQGDAVPTAPVTVAVSLADKLDTIAAFFGIDEAPTGSRDPFALRRAALGVIRMVESGLRFSLGAALRRAGSELHFQEVHRIYGSTDQYLRATAAHDRGEDAVAPQFTFTLSDSEAEIAFFADRLKVQQREAGVRHDLIDAVFALGGEDDLVRLLARVKALQAFVETPDGANLLAGYKRAANILKKEGWGGQSSPERGGGPSPAEAMVEGHPEIGPDSNLPHHHAAHGIPQTGEEDPLSQVEDLPDLTVPAKNTLDYEPEPAENALIAALDSAEPRAASAIAAEDFAAAMTALATLRAPIDRFFDEVTVNAPDPARRQARLALLARIRAAVHTVADFSRIEGQA